MRCHSYTVTALVVLIACSSGVAFAQEEDLLQGLGGEEEKPTPAPAAKPAAKPTEAPAEDAGLSDADLDVDAPLDDTTAAPAETKAKEEAKAKEPPAPKAPPIDPSKLDRVKAVQRKPVIKEYRLEIAPQFGVSLNDAYFTHLMVGGGVVFYPHDNFGIGASGYYYLAHLRSDAHKVIRIGNTAVPAVFDHPVGGASLDLHWNPVYGKISLIEQVIVPFDLYAVVGGGLMITGPNIRPAFRVGIGQRFFVNEWLGVRIEVVDTVYNDTQEVNGQPRSDLQNFIMFLAGASFFVPPSFEYSSL